MIMKVELLNRVENFVAIGDKCIAHHEQFLLLSQCFQKSSAVQIPHYEFASGKGLKRLS